MKVLWVSASAIGPASRILNQKYSGSSGVWIQTIYEELIQNNNVEMYFICFSKKLKKNEIISKQTKEGSAHCLSMPKISLGRSAPRHLKKNVEKVIRDIKPDIIHIWGTETCVQNVIAEVVEEIPKVVFLQGLIGIHDRYHNVNLNKIGINYRKKLNQIVHDKFHDFLFHRQIQFEALEIKKSGNVLVDNLFSTAYCKSLSNSISVYEYPLNPSNAFQKHIWSYSSCTPNTIFTIYGSSQDKGLHQLLRALTIVKKFIPNVRLYIPGKFNINKHTGQLSKTKLNSYERLLLSIILDGKLLENIEFCGQLTQEQMALKLKQANMFVNPSIMEVHAGSLREAMLVGTPSISTYCGSVGEYLKDGENGLLYRYEEHEVLAFKIIYLLNNPDKCERLSRASRESILCTKNHVNKSLYDIYKDIICK